MTRKIIAAFSTIACGGLVAGSVLAQAPGASLVSPNYTVTNIDPRHFRGDAAGKFSVRGLPRLHASLPKKHVTLDAVQLDGVVDTESKLLKSAVLTGGVTGTLDSASHEGGTEHVTFSGSEVKYTNQGGPNDQSADIDASGTAAFRSENKTLRRAMSLTGSHGLFKLRTVGDRVGLISADLDGPVQLDFTGLLLEKDGTKKQAAAKKTPVSGTATGGHLAISRPTGSTNYLITLSGGVQMRELTGPLPGAELDTTVVHLELDENGALIRFWGDDEVKASVPVGKPRT